MQNLIGKYSRHTVWLFALGAVPLGIAAAYATAGLGPKVTAAVYAGIVGLAGFASTFTTKARTRGAVLAFLVAALAAAAVYYLVVSAVFRDGLAGIFAFGAVLGVSVYGISQADVLIFGVVASTVAAAGAVLGGRIDDRVGAKPILICSLSSLIVVGIALIPATGSLSVLRALRILRVSSLDRLPRIERSRPRYRFRISIFSRSLSICSVRSAVDAPMSFVPLAMEHKGMEGWTRQGMAGSTSPRTSPKPMRTPSFSACPRMISVSPSSRNFRSLPSCTFSGPVPFQVSSRRLP